MHLEHKDQGLIICLLAIYYPMKAFGHLDSDLDMNMDDDQDVANYAEMLVQQYNLEHVRRMNG